MGSPEKDDEEVAQKEDAEEECSEFGAGSECEEGRQPRVLKGHASVSQKEREDHEATHAPFTARCPYCVKGRGRNMRHKLNPSEKK